MKHIGVILTAVLLAGCATAPGIGDAVGTVTARPSASGAEQWVTVDSLRPTAYFTDGEESMHLGLLVEGGKVVGYRRVDEAEADVSLSVIKRDDGRTMVDLASHSDMVLKLDLHISPDNLRYMYTSSCPIIANGSAFEMWPYEIAWFAVSNIRSLGPDEGRVCR
jgi:hypothetical protein